MLKSTPTENQVQCTIYMKHNNNTTLKPKDRWKYGDQNDSDSDAQVSYDK